MMLASGGMSRRLSNLMKNLAIILREISEKNILKVFLFRGVPENPSKSIGLRKWLHSCGQIVFDDDGESASQFLSILDS